MGEKIPKILLVGAPNVGKSMIFYHLTGAYVVVSNYPGTTVDITSSRATLGGRNYEIVDTPGMYSLAPVTDEERVTFDVLRTSMPYLVIYVIDAKNIKRMLPMALQLLDGGFPLLIVLNMMDEAEQLGMQIHTARLAEMLGVPVVATAAAHGRGISFLKQSIRICRPAVTQPFLFRASIEEAIKAMSELMENDYGFSKRLAALLLLQQESFLCSQAKHESNWSRIAEAIEILKGQTDMRLDCYLALERQAQVEGIIQLTVRTRQPCAPSNQRWIDMVTCHPLLGMPLLLLVLYLGLYQFVGNFGAGYLVDFLNNIIFIKMINPAMEQLVQSSISPEWAQSLLTGEYGLFSLGIRYAMAIVLPIVGTFFLAFALLEDCGYLPRLAMLVDRLFKAIGLNGRAVIPVILGLGCGTMAVMVTRTLETRRERLIATFLLALTIPCSAQLGLVLSLLSHNQVALFIWLGYVVTIFLSVGWLTARIVSGEGSIFYMELPPMRMPALKNIITKAYYRMAWYFLEIIPIFLVTSLLLWLADRADILSEIMVTVEPAVKLLGLPAEAAEALILGFFRRDYGAAGLYDLVSDGVLSDHQLLVATVTLTLFMPCVAQFAVMIKERGLMITLLMSGTIAIVALLSGWLVHKGVEWLCLL